MKFVEVIDSFSHIRKVPVDQIQDRYGVYGLILRDRKILLMRVKQNNTFWFVGGAIEAGEDQEQALRREALEETGLQITIDRLFMRHDYFFHMSHKSKDFHCYNSYYLCRTNDELSVQHTVVDEIADCPHWEDVATLRKEQFHPVVWSVVEKLQTEIQGHQK